MSESHRTVLEWLRRRGLAPRAIEKTARFLEEAPHARWTSISFAPSLYMRTDDPQANRRLTLAQLVAAAEAGRLSEVEL
jgi:hypothetical protein